MPSSPPQATRANRLIEQQRMLTEFAAFALGNNDLDEVLTRACRIVASGLNEDTAKVVQLQHGGAERLYLRCAIGLDVIRDEDRWLEAGRGSSAGHALLTGRAVFCPDVARETRFTIADLMRRNNIRSMVNVPIRDLDRGGWFGVLEVDSRRTHGFDEDALTFLDLYGGLIAAAVEQNRVHDRLRAAQERAQALVEEKTRLHRELQHRVKNNLAVVTALTRIQASRTVSEEAKTQLRAIGRRVEALRLVYDKLYASDRLDAVALPDYLGELVHNLLAFFGEDAAHVRLVTDIAPVRVPIESAVALGLIVNEFLTNSVRHAFDKAGGTVRLLVAEDDARLTVTLADDGRGMPEGAPATGHTGQFIIKGLAQQLGGEGAWGRPAGGGTEYRLSVPRR